MASKYTKLFEEFWKNFPNPKGRRTNKPGCFAKWKAKKVEESHHPETLRNLAQFIIDDVKTRATQDRQWLEGYSPAPMTYLNQERWDDEWEKVKTRPNGPAQPEQEADPMFINEGMKGTARRYGIQTEGLTLDEVEQLIWAKRVGRFHIECLPEKLRAIHDGQYTPF